METYTIGAAIVFSNNQMPAVYRHIDLTSKGKSGNRYMSFDYLIVGAGFFGSVLAERIATVLNSSVVVVDKKDHVGGQCYSETHTGTGIEIHRYGTHIFHTDDPEVWQYINRHTEFNGYRHQVLTTYRNRVYQMPLNLSTINAFYGMSMKPDEAKAFLAEEARKAGCGQPKNLEEKAMSVIGRPLYEAFIRGYTFKQWQKDPRELPASIITRLPVRFNYDPNYFNNARWQGIPLNGYTAVFEALLASPNITVRPGCDYFEAAESLRPSRMTIYSGPIDRYFGYRFGRLEWRTVYFSESVENTGDFQGTSVMNYADMDIPYTRIHEPRHLHPERIYPDSQTVIFHETSGYNPDDPYYPVNTPDNMARVRKYRELAKTEPGVVFGGRQGDYAYYDMDQTIKAALECFDTTIKTAYSAGPEAQSH
jgi:UDP-galactopyranose mutase